MTEETARKTIVASLALAQANFKPIPKRRTARVQTKSGGEYSYSYADLSDVLSAVQPALNEQGIFLSQPHNFHEQGYVIVVTRLMHAGGEVLESPGFLVPIPEKATPQDLGGLLSYGRRYDLCALLGIAPEESVELHAQRQRNTARPQQRREPETQPSDRITKDQDREWYQTAMKSGWTLTDVKDVLKKHGIPHSSRIPPAKLDELMTWAKKGPGDTAGGNPG